AAPPARRESSPPPRRRRRGTSRPRTSRGRLGRTSIGHLAERVIADVAPVLNPPERDVGVSLPVDRGPQTVGSISVAPRLRVRSLLCLVSAHDSVRLSHRRLELLGEVGLGFGGVPRVALRGLLR